MIYNSLVCLRRLSLQLLVPLLKLHLIWSLQVMELDTSRRSDPKPIIKTSSPTNGFAMTSTLSVLKKPIPYMYANIPSGVVRLPVDADKALAGNYLSTPSSISPWQRDEIFNC